MPMPLNTVAQPTKPLPQPVSQMPWTQEDDATVVRDAQGLPVSFVANAPFIMHRVSTHDELVTAFWRALCALETAYITLETLTGQPRTDKHRAWMNDWLNTLNTVYRGEDPIESVKRNMNEAGLTGATWG